MATILGDFSSGLVSHWKLDETSGTREDIHSTNDLIANGTGGVGSGTGLNTGADLERGDSDYLSIADASQSGLDISGTFSVSMWYKIETFPSADMGFINKCNFGTGSDLAYLIYMRNTGAIQLYVADSSGNVSNPETTNTYATNGALYHFAAVWNSSSPTTATFYINGSSVSVTNNSTANTGNVRNSARPFLIGAYESNTAATAHFDGIIDEVSIWSGYALTGSDVTTIYNGGAGIAYSSGSTPSPLLTLMGVG